MTMLAQACEAKAKLIRSSWRSSSDAISSRISSGRRRSGGRALLWVLDRRVLSERAGKGQSWLKQPPLNRVQAYVTTPRPSLTPLVRLYAQHCDYFSRPTHHSASSGGFYLETTYHHPHESTNMRTVRSAIFLHRKLLASPMQPGLFGHSDSPLPENTLPRQERASATQSSLGRRHNPNT